MATHSSQMYVDGPAMSCRTALCGLLQNEQRCSCFLPNTALIIGAGRAAAVQLRVRIFLTLIPPQPQYEPPVTPIGPPH